MNDSIPNIPSVISDLFRNKDPKIQKKGYMAFLKRTHWLISPTLNYLKEDDLTKYESTDPNHLKQIACSQLGISTKKVICSHITTIQPGLLWSSQSGLEADKLNMVQAAFNYFKHKNLEFPPIIVWNFFDSQKMRYIVHDGHHRTYFSYRLNQKLRAVILEPLGVYEEVQNKFKYAFRIRKRVVDLPISGPMMKTHLIQGKSEVKNLNVNANPVTSSVQSEQAQVVQSEITVSKLDIIQTLQMKEKLGRHKGRYDFVWNHIDINNFGENELRHYDIIDVMKMFNRRSKPMVPELAYLAFLIRSRWGITFNIERGVTRAQLELRLPLYEGEGLTWSHRKLNPAKIWASQDSLDEDTLNMIRAAMKYMVDGKKPIPPVIVWLVKNSSRYNYVCHDGHHRIFVANELKREIPVILLEYWIDNREDPLLRRKIQYEKINAYTINLPIEKFHGIRYTKRRERYTL